MSTKLPQGQEGGGAVIEALRIVSALTAGALVACAEPMWAAVGIYFFALIAGGTTATLIVRNRSL